MSTWIKRGVYGELHQPAAEGLRKVERLFGQHGQDLFITSIREGTHSMGSFHPLGLAWDMRSNAAVTPKMIREVLGDDFDVVEERTHIHVEWDPR